MIKNYTNKGQGYWQVVRRQFKKNKRALWSLYFVLFMAFIALFADFIANSKPLALKTNDKIYFPVIHQYGVDLGLCKWPQELLNINWIEKEFDWALRAPIPYSPSTLDLNNAQYVAPFGEQDIKSLRWRHWLGTEKLGRDVFSALIHGTRIAFLVGIISMSLASLIGIFLGAIAGFFGDKKIKTRRGSFVIVLITVFLGYFYGFKVRGFTIEEAAQNSMSSFYGQLLLSIGIFVGIILIGVGLGRILSRLPFFNKKMALPFDMIISRMIEIMVSVPKLFLIIAIVAIVKPSIFLVMAVIGLTSWTGIARFIRAELLRIRNLEYIEASKALGFSNFRTLFRHAIPNALSPVLITIAFGIAAAILVEAFLSFIGIGIPSEVLTWGKLLSLARSAPSAWWLAIFPGFAIFITVTLFNLIGEGLTDALDPKLKQ